MTRKTVGAKFKPKPARTTVGGTFAPVAAAVPQALPIAAAAELAPELLAKAQTGMGKVLDAMNNEFVSMGLNDDLDWVGVDDPSAVFKIRLTPAMVLAAGGLFFLLTIANPFGKFLKKDKGGFF